MMPNMLNPRGAVAVAASGEVMHAAGGLLIAGQSTVAVATFDALSTPSPTDSFYSQFDAGQRFVLRWQWRRRR